MILEHSAVSDKSRDLLPQHVSFRIYHVVQFLSYFYVCCIDVKNTIRAAVSSVDSAFSCVSFVLSVAVFYSSRSAIRGRTSATSASIFIDKVCPSKRCEKLVLFYRTFLFLRCFLDSEGAGGAGGDSFWISSSVESVFGSSLMGLSSLCNVPKRAGCCCKL